MNAALTLTEPEVPYQVTVTAVVCGSSVIVYDQLWFTRSSSFKQTHIALLICGELTMRHFHISW